MNATDNAATMASVTAVDIINTRRFIDVAALTPGVGRLDVARETTPGLAEL